MKKVNLKYRKMLNKVIAGVLSLLGFASCTFFSPVMYGSPNGSYFKVDGKVVSAETDSAINNIQIKVQKINYEDHTFYSDTNGRFILDYDYLNTDTLSFHLTFKDIDSTQNGEFETLDTIITFRDLDTSNDAINSDSLKIKLKPKE